MSFDLFDMSSAYLHFSDFENAVLPYALGLVYGVIALWVRAEAGNREYVKPVVELETDVDSVSVPAFEVLGEAVSNLFRSLPPSLVDAAMPLDWPVPAYREAVENGFEEVLVEMSELTSFKAQYQAVEKELGQSLEVFFDVPLTEEEKEIVDRELDKLYPAATLINPPPLSAVDAADAGVMQQVIKKKSRKVGALIKDLWEESDESDRLAAKQTSTVDESINFKNFEGIDAEWLDYGSFASE